MQFKTAFAIGIIAMMLANGLIGIFSIAEVKAETKSGYTSHNPIYIDGNSGFNSTNGVKSGDGSQGNPYVIEGWDIDAVGEVGIDIRNTDKYFMIQNCFVQNVTGYYEYKSGIYFNNVTNGKIKNCKIKNNDDGILLIYSSKIILENNYESNGLEGIHLAFSTNVTLRNNIMYNNSYSLIVYGNEKSHYSHGIDPSNTINGKPINYYFNIKNQIIENLDSSQITLAYCYGVTLQNNNITDGDGIKLWYTENSIIKNNNCYDNHNFGIDVEYSSRNSIVNNNITKNWNGVRLDFSSDNNIVNNNISLNGWGGIEIFSSSGNEINNNNVSDNHEEGISLISSSSNKIYINNIINNFDQALDDNNNSWDYQGKGNYWSDYKGKDSNNDGIGDTPYLISGGNNKDNSPLMKPNPNAGIQNEQNQNQISETKNEFPILYIEIIGVIIISIAILTIFLLRRNKLKSKIPQQPQYPYQQYQQPMQSYPQYQQQYPYQQQSQPQTSQYQPMPQSITCPNCQSSFQVSSQIRPLQVQCPYCGLKGELK